MLTFGIDWDDVISPLNDCAIELANEEYDNYKFEVRTTAGSSANLRLLSDNYIELGIAQRLPEEQQSACHCRIIYRSMSACCKG